MSPSDLNILPKISSKFSEIALSSSGLIFLDKTKLETYISFLENNKDFKARFFDIGDFTFISTGKDRNE